LETPEDDLKINPVAVANAFRSMVMLQFPEYEDEDPDGRCTIFAKKLFKKFLNLLDDLVFRDKEELEKAGVYKVSEILIKLANKIFKIRFTSGGGK